MKVSAQAPGKIILFGEHAVVYGRPAIAVPVAQVNVRATVEATGGGVTVESRERGRQTPQTPMGDLADDDPLAAIISRALRSLDIADSPNIKITIESTIPIAGGLGSGAAVSTAIARALAKYFGRELTAPQISAMVYEVEKIHHGTPSGIDNTVIAFEKPVYYVRPHVIETFSVPVPFRLAIADTGIASPTKIAVGDVRRAWEADKAKYESLFDRCGDIAKQARALIECGQPGELGALMNENHKVLREIGVSCAELETLLSAAIKGGAAGAKLSGAGRGGNMIALVTEANEANVRDALLRAGAKRVVITEVSALPPSTGF